MNQKETILLTGAKPTGELHLGNYFGMIKPAIEASKEASISYVFIADLHALTSVQNGDELRKGILHLAAAYLAAGLNKDKTILFKQSDIPAHSELAWIFDCITDMPYLARAHAFKAETDKLTDSMPARRFISSKFEQLTGIGVGVFNYPMLMAADILLYDTNIVPVGADQKQHVEYARDTAEKFNRIYGETFVLPEAKITDGVGTITGIDGRKMSKSYKNVIPLFADSEIIKSQIMSIVTDSKGANDPKDPETCNIFSLHKLITPKDTLLDLEKRYKEGTISYKESKEILFEHTEKLISPMREKYQHFINNKDELKSILNKGGEVARQIADKKMSDIKKRIGVSF